MSLLPNKRLKLGSSYIGSSRNSRRNRNRRMRKRMNKKPAAARGAGETENLESQEITIFDDETDYYWGKDNFKVEGNNVAAADDDEEERAFQQALFCSAQLFHSGKNSGQNPGKKILCCTVTSGSLTRSGKSKREKGGASCIYCVICDDAKPPNTVKRGSSCEHYYCEECIRNYIAEKIDDDIEQVKCPVSNCLRILDLESLMPREFLDRLSDVIRETKILASPTVIECPFLDCPGELIDDKKKFLIRACPSCWRIFCVRCRDSWHLGVSCSTYQHNLYLQRQKRLFWDSWPEKVSRLVGNNNGDGDEGQI